MIFVDTGALLARHLPSDQHHASATEAWRDLTARGDRLATTNLVIGEYLTLLTRRTSPAFAVDRARVLYASSALTVIRPVESDEAQAILLLGKHGAAGAGFVDCLSFAMMRTHSIPIAFTFDHHFSDAGFEVFPAV